MWIQKFKIQVDKLKSLVLVVVGRWTVTDCLGQEMLSCERGANDWQPAVLTSETPAAQQQQQASSSCCCLAVA